MTDSGWNARNSIGLTDSVSTSQIYIAAVRQTDLHIEVVAPMTGKTNPPIRSQISPDQKLPLERAVVFFVHTQLQKTSAITLITGVMSIYIVRLFMNTSNRLEPCTSR